MPVRVVSSGLPQYRVEDSGTPLTEGLSRASETLLSLGPKLAQIKMERDQRARQNALQQQHLGLQERQLGAEQEHQRGMLGVSQQNATSMEQYRRDMGAERQARAKADAERQNREDYKAKAQGLMPLEPGEDVTNSQVLSPENRWGQGPGGSLLPGESLLRAPVMITRQEPSQLAKMAAQSAALRQAQIGKIEAEAGKDEKYTPTIHRTPDQISYDEMAKQVDSMGYFNLDKPDDMARRATDIKVRLDQRAKFLSGVAGAAMGPDTTIKNVLPTQNPNYNVLVNALKANQPKD